MLLGPGPGPDYQTFTNAGKWKSLSEAETGRHERHGLEHQRGHGLGFGDGDVDVGTGGDLGTVRTYMQSADLGYILARTSVITADVGERADHHWPHRHTASHVCFIPSSLIAPFVSGQAWMPSALIRGRKQHRPGEIYRLCHRFSGLQRKRRNE
jgi:hypothetical protein